MTRAALVLAVLAALAGCAQPAPAPPASPGSSASAGPVELSGRLSRKGPDETSFWAVTGADGKTWQIVDVSPALEARLRPLEHRQVVLRVEPAGRSLLEQVRVVEVVTPAP